MKYLPSMYKDDATLYLVPPLSEPIQPSSLFILGKDNKSIKYNNEYAKANNITGNFTGRYTFQTEGAPVTRTLFFQFTV